MAYSHPYSHQHLPSYNLHSTTVVLVLPCTTSTFQNKPFRFGTPYPSLEFFFWSRGGFFPILETLGNSFLIGNKPRAVFDKEGTCSAFLFQPLENEWSKHNYLTCLREDLFFHREEGGTRHIDVSKTQWRSNHLETCLSVSGNSWSTFGA